MAAGDGEWKAVFNAMDKPCCDGFGVGFVRFGGAGGTNLTWLTNTNGAYERDPVMARLPDAPGGGERYLVGWRMSNTGEFYLAVVSGTERSSKAPIQSAATESRGAIATTHSRAVPMVR